MTPPFGEMLRTFRVHAGLSQEALSEASGVSVRTISDLERGQRPSAQLETIRLLANALGLTSDEHHQLLESAHPAARERTGIPLRPVGRIVAIAHGANRWSRQGARGAPCITAITIWRDRDAHRDRRRWEDSAGNRSRASAGARTLPMGQCSSISLR